MNWTERFQTTLPGKAEGPKPWASDASARHSASQKKLEMPPGYEISGHGNFRSTLSDRNDVTNESSPAAMKKGFTKHGMKGTDDQYTGEHADQFYGDADGFVERNNYLDRL